MAQNTDGPALPRDLKNRAKSAGDNQTAQTAGGKDGDAFEKFVQQMTSPEADCNALYRSHKTATEITSVQFDSCYYNHTLKDGHSRQLEVPVMSPNQVGPPTAKLERITTEGVTKDSRRLDVFEHALQSVRPVYFDHGKGRTSGTAFMVSPDGLMATNNHVVEGSNGTLQVDILNKDGTEETRIAHVVKQVPTQDLALLQVDHKPGELFQPLALSKETSWREHEPLVEMGNANGEGSISMSKAAFGSLVNQNGIPFDQQPPDVFQGRSLFELNSTVPHGYSGGVVLSVPGSSRDADGNVTRQGTSAIRAVTDYSDIQHKAWVIPAARVQNMLDEYQLEEAKKKK